MKRRIFAIFALLMLLALPAAAQRRVTPVNNAATATQHVNLSANDSIDRSHLIEMTDNRGNKILVDTISGREFVDSAAIERSIPKMIFPLLHSASVSVDLFTPLMRVLGQKHGLVEFAAELNLHNRYIPVVEIGLGQAHYSPSDNNYTYRSSVAPFFRIGANYNFFYNSNPDYLIMVGVRYGLSPFKFSVTDITPSGSYWGEPQPFDIPSQSVTAGYFEVLLGLRVRIFGNFSLGWSARYHSIMHESATKYGQPWYIPGFGPRGSALTATFSLTYTLPLHQKSDLQANGKTD